MSGNGAKQFRPNGGRRELCRLLRVVQGQGRVAGSQEEESAIGEESGVPGQGRYLAIEIADLGQEFAQSLEKHDLPPHRRISGCELRGLLHIGEGGLPAVQVPITDRALEQGRCGRMIFHPAGPGRSRLRPTGINLLEAGNFEENPGLAILLPDRFGPGGEGVDRSSLGQGEIPSELIIFGGNLFYPAAPFAQSVAEAGEIAGAVLRLGQASPRAVIVRREIQNFSGQRNRPVEGALLQRLAQLGAHGSLLLRNVPPATGREEIERKHEGEQEAMRRWSREIHWRERRNTEGKEGVSSLFRNPQSEIRIMPSFDIVSEIDKQEIDNALNQARKELASRFDFKGTVAEIEHEKDQIVLTAEDASRLRGLREIVIGKLSKRGIDLRNLDQKEPAISSIGHARQELKIQQGLEGDKAKEIILAIKGEGFKTQNQLQDRQIRVTGKKRDELQEVIAFVKSKDFGVATNFKNFRD